MNYKRQSILIWSIIILIGILTAALAANSQTLTPPENADHRIGTSRKQGNEESTDIFTFLFEQMEN